MAASKHVAKKLRAMLGSEAEESMVEWLDERDTRDDELRRETRAGFAAVEASAAAAPRRQPGASRVQTA